MQLGAIISSRADFLDVHSQYSNNNPQVIFSLQVPIYVYAGNIQKYTLKYVVMWEMW